MIKQKQYDEIANCAKNRLLNIYSTNEAVKLFENFEKMIGNELEHKCYMVNQLMMNENMMQERRIKCVTKPVLDSLEINVLDVLGKINTRSTITNSSIKYPSLSQLDGDFGDNDYEARE